MEKNICFAYYADNKFIGWYADSFGSVRKYPKLYGNSKEQIEIITRNFRYKINEINKEFYNEKHERFMEKVNSEKGLDPGDGEIQLITFASHDSESLLRNKDVELRVVECPIYDGLNPDFNEELYKEYITKNPDCKRSELPSHLKSWIYADFKQIKEWSSIEPKEYIATIKPLEKETI